MKLSEMLKLIAGLYEVGTDFDPYTRADNLLCQLEELGMCPPPDPTTTSPFGGHACQWEYEGENHE